MNFSDFQAKWDTGGTAASLNERQGAQPHFMDLCALLGVPTPGTDENYIFEQDTLMLGEARGFCDVFKRGHFAWENKAPGKDLDKALKQLLGYSMALSNPPLLVVCDRATIRIHTQFTGHPTEVHTVLIDELAQPEKRALLKKLWDNPEWFRPKETSRDITLAAANSFASLADTLRTRGCVLDKKGNVLSGTPIHSPEVISHFLTQCLFCFFAEDVGLLPDRLFQKMIDAKLDVGYPGDTLPSEKLRRGLNSLFLAMHKGDLFGTYDISRFNGGLFENIQVPKLEIMDITELRNAARLNWSAIDVSIFGTLFERGLDPKKRSQQGAHYTDPGTIMRIIDPVIRHPLLQKWEQSKQEIHRLVALSKAKSDKNHKLAKAEFVRWLEDLRAYRILDPACGSGNFLFLGLKVLKDIEHKSHLEAAEMGLDRETDLVTGPHNMLGLEINEYAAELARMTVWIGELQWRMQKGYDFNRNPVLQPLKNIECRDALLTASAGVANWPNASVIVGNPPFIGSRKILKELGSSYAKKLRSAFHGFVPDGADFVCYWFEQAKRAIDADKLFSSGFVATQSVRKGQSAAVLQRLLNSAYIFEAWSDEPWVNDGAAVRVCMVCFAEKSVESPQKRLNGNLVDSPIGASLTELNQNSVESAKQLAESADTLYQGLIPLGPFDISGKDARQWLKQPNAHMQSNEQVLFLRANANDLAKRWSDTWLIAFGERDATEAALFEEPWRYAEILIKPARKCTKDEDEVKPWDIEQEKFWWRHWNGRPELRQKLAPLNRYIATPRVSKHRFFVWLHARVLPDTRLNAILRADDTTFGVLHSRIHEVWSLATSSMHGVGNDPTYNAKSCFETFPFPAGLTPQDTASQQTRRLASGAVVPVLSVRPEPVEGSLKASTSSARTGETTRTGGEVARTVGESIHWPASRSDRKGGEAARTVGESIAEAAHKLTTLRDNWLNPPDWTQRLPEVVPLGMATSPYPDRIVPKLGFEKELSERTLTKLYNARPAWLASAHAALDQAVATAYGWMDYTAEMADEVILQRLLALNVERSQP